MMDAGAEQHQGESHLKLTDTTDDSDITNAKGTTGSDQAEQGVTFKPLSERESPSKDIADPDQQFEPAQPYPTTISKSNGMDPNLTAEEPDVIQRERPKSETGYKPEAEQEQLQKRGIDKELDEMQKKELYKYKKQDALQSQEEKSDENQEKRSDDSDSTTQLLPQQDKRNKSEDRYTDKDKDKKKCKIFVIGKTGTGKSSLCNKIIGRNAFATGRSFKQVTTETTTLSGLNIIVVDTPDISGESESRQKEIVDSWKRDAKGYHYMVVLTVRCDARYSPAEYEVYRQIRQLWGHDLVKRLVVAFTFGDTREDQSLDMEQELANVWPELKHVMKDANNRFVVFNNEAGNMDETPVTRLVEHLTRLPLKKTNKMSKPFKFLIGVTGCMIALSFVYLVFTLADIDPIGAFIDLMTG